MPTDATYSTHEALAPQTPAVATSAKLALPVLLYMIFVVSPVEFSLGSLALTPIRVLLLALVVPLTLRLFSGQFGKVTAVDVLFFMHMTWATLAVAVNNPNRVIENVGSAAVEFLGGYLVGRAYIRTPEQFMAMIKLFVVIVAILLPFGIPELFSGKPVVPTFIDSLPGFSSAEDINNPPRMGFERVQNVFDHPIHYGLYCSVAFTLLILGLHGQLSYMKRAFWASFILAGVLISLSSGAILPIILQVFLLGWAIVFRRVQRKWLLLLALFAVVYVAIDVMSNRTPTKVFMTYATFSPQTAYYRANINEWGMVNVRQNPIFGLGLRNWIRPAYMQRGSVDNYWLVMAMKYGIPGFLLIAAGYIAGLFLVGLAKLDASPLASRLRLAWMITFCGMSFTLVTVHVWSTMYSFVFFLFGTGMWLIDYKGTDGGAGGAGPAPGTASPARTLTYRRAHAAAPPRETPVARFSREHQEEAPPQRTSGGAPIYSRSTGSSERGGTRYRRDHGKPTSDDDGGAA